MGKKAILLLCICQLISNGSMYFSLPLLINYISLRDGTSVTALQTALSSAFVFSALLSPFTGRCIDLFSGKIYLPVWSVVGGVTFGLIIITNSIAGIGLLFFMNQMSANFCVYEAVYPPILRILNSDRRECNRIINWIIISCSMSPSFTWPICEYVHSNLGLDYLLWLFAGINILVCAPIYYFCFHNDLLKMKNIAQDIRQRDHRAADQQMLRIVIVNLFLCAISYSLNGIYYNMKYLCDIVAFPSERMTDYGALISIGAIAVRLYYISISKLRKSFDQIIIVAVSFACITFSLLIGGKSAMISFFLLSFGICQSSVLFLRTALPAENQNNSDIGQRLGILGMCRKLAVACAPIGFSMQEKFLGLENSLLIMLIVIIMFSYLLICSSFNKRRV